MLEETTSASNEITLQDILELLRRRKGTVIQTFLSVLIVCLVVTLLSKPVYRSTAQILVEGKGITLAQVNTEDPLGNLFLPPTGHDVDTQIAVLQSRSLLNDAYQAAGLQPDAVHLDVKQVNTTDVIELAVESTNPDYAKRFATVLPNVYLKYVTGNRQEEVTKALAFASARLDAENTKLLRAELALARFKKRRHVSNLDAERNERISRASEAEAEMRRAEATVADHQAQLDALLAARRALPEFLETPTTSSNTQQIDQQKQKIADLQAERAAKTILFKPNNPEIQKLDAQITEQQARLNQMPAMVTTVTRAPNPAVATLDNQITQAQAALTGAQAVLVEARARAAHMTTDLDKYSDIERQQAELQRAVDQGQNMVSMLSKSVEDLNLRQQATHPPVLTITPAEPPEKIYPRPLKNFLFATLIGLILGLGLAFLQDYLEDSINTPTDARRILEAPALGYVPQVEKQEGCLLINPQSSASLLESYRMLRSNVRFAAVNAPIRSILVTSTSPGEGKSVTASNLAIAMALDGRRVILIDTDLRRPTIHQKFNLPAQPGLTNVLVDHVSLEEALYETPIPGLRVLTSGPLPPNPAELLSSTPMSQLHATLKEMADIIILDSPPCLAAADAPVLSAMTDGVLYVMQLGLAKRSAVRHSIELLEQAHARLLGTVFSKIQTNGKQNGYYYSYYNYYQHGKSEALLQQASTRPKQEAATNEAIVRTDGNLDKRL